MGRCLYTWEGWDSEKGEYVKKFCQNETWKGSDEFCIFHDPSPDKNRDLFKKKLDEQMNAETGKYDFIGYYFPRNWNFFKKTEFEIDVNFSRAIFHNVKFSGATFQNAKFENAIFQKAANFNGTTFKKANFDGAKFQKYVKFEDATFQGCANFWSTFQGDVNFWGATFQGCADFGTDFQKAIFREAHFQSNANFMDATFQKTANFIRTTFEKAANFEKAVFHSNVDFREVNFKNANFKRATFHKKVELKAKNIEKLDLRHTEFLLRTYITANLTKTLFHRSFIENVTFDNCKWPRCKKLFRSHICIYEENHMNEEDIDLTYNQLETIYRDLKQNMQDHGDYTKAGELYYREMEMKRNQYKLFRKKWWIQNILHILCGYGEKPLWVIRNAIIIIILGAISYFFSGIARVGAEIPDCSSPYIINYSLKSLNLSFTILNDFFYCLYYSVVTFTTLGYGDIHPVGKVSHAISFVEAFIGAFFIALFVVVFVRKMAR